MINDEFICLIGEKIQSLEKEKRRLQITHESEKLKQIEAKQQTLYTMANYPLSFVSNKCSDEEIEYIISLYRASIETNLEQVNQEIDGLMEKWTDANFLNEVVVYTIFKMISSKKFDELRTYLDLLQKSHDKPGSLYYIKNINEIAKGKFQELADIMNLIDYRGSLEVVSEKIPDFESFESKFENDVIEYSNQYVANVAKNGRITLPFSEEVRSLLSKRIAPLLGKKNALEEKLKDYKNIDLNDKNSRQKYVDEIIKNTYQTYTTSLPFYASYDLDKFDKLLKLTDKIDNVEDKELLLETIEAYKKQLESKSKHDESEKYKAKYQSKFDRFQDIDQMLHMGNYIEGDTVDYFSVFIRHTLYNMGISFCERCEYIDDLTKRQFGGNDKLIEEVKQKLEKIVEESDIKNQIAQYKKLKNSLISKMHKEKIGDLEEKIKGEITSIVMSIRNSYAKEGYQLFQELPFLNLVEGDLCRASERIDLENVVKKDNNMLFNANYVSFTNKLGHVFGGTFESFMGVGKGYNEDFEEIMQTLHGTINKMTKDNITEEELSLLCGLTEPELKEITKENALFKMQTVREIMAKYDELEDKTLISDDYKAESPKFGK